jgi:hypothetical protein
VSVVLNKHNLDWYDAHTPLRHVHAFPTSPHIVFVALPIYLQEHPAFTPYLKDGYTVPAKEYAVVAYAIALPEHTCVFAFAANAQHVHSSLNAGDHAASFQIRVGGKSLRALFYTCCSCPKIIIQSR